MDAVTRILTAGDVEAVLGVEECIEAVEEAFRLLALGGVEPPGILAVHVEGGGFHVKAAALRAARHYFAAKVNANFPANPAANALPTIQGVLVLSDADLGTPLAVMDSIAITELRTAAATAVAARYLSRPGASMAAIVGCGAQAASQLRALAAVRPLGVVRAYDVDRARAQSFAERMTEELGVEVRAVPDLPAAVTDCEICVTCTPSREPLLYPGMLRRGAFIAAVGADAPHKVEVDPRLMGGAKVVVDSAAQCREIGDLRWAIEAAAMRESDVHADLGAVVAGLAEGWSPHDDVVVFDSTGLGLQDVAAAAVAYERAVENGRGVQIRLGGG